MVASKHYTSSTSYFKRSHEQAFLLAKGKPAPPARRLILDDVRHRWQYTGNRHHPTEKPVGNLIPLIQSFRTKDALILDPFAGSASTGIAALKAGRRFIGIELDEAIHAIANARIEAVKDTS